MPIVRQTDSTTRSVTTTGTTELQRIDLSPTGENLLALKGVAHIQLQTAGEATLVLRAIDATGKSPHRNHVQVVLSGTYTVAMRDATKASTRAPAPSWPPAWSGARHDPAPVRRSPEPATSVLPNAVCPWRDPRRENPMPVHHRPVPAPLALTTVLLLIVLGASLAPAATSTVTVGSPLTGRVTIDGGALGTPPTVTWTSELSCIWAWSGWDVTDATCTASGPSPVPLLPWVCATPGVDAAAQGLQGWVTGQTTCGNEVITCMDETWTASTCHAEAWYSYGEPLPLQCLAEAAGLLSMWTVSCYLFDGTPDPTAGP